MCDSAYDRTDGPSREDIAREDYERREGLQGETWTDVTECQYCGEGPLVYLGQLGHVTHWRCRACGSTQPIALHDLDEDVREAIEDEDR
jgi:hypothetical protein